MRFKLSKRSGKKLKYTLKNSLPVMVYPRMYCPRCGSVEINLRMLAGGEAIWECGDCLADFRLVFPSRNRF